MERLKRKWKRVPAPVRKPLILIVGVSVVATGLALLVLPGPGWAAIFLGFAILATEFAAAAKVRDWFVKELKRSIAKAKRAWRRFRRKRKNRSDNDS